MQISLSVTPPLLNLVAWTTVLKANDATDDSEVQNMERCRNPWKDNCKSENIKLYIELKGEKLPICQQCWNIIADQGIEW